MEVGRRASASTESSPGGRENGSTLRQSDGWYGAVMFTGLVQHVGTVMGIEPSAAGRVLTIDAGTWPDRAPSDGASTVPALALGESIAVSGCCLTLVSVANPSMGPSLGPSLGSTLLSFDVIHQTLRVTALGRCEVGTRVNLERSATPLTLLGGHIVQGHVDGLGRVAATGNREGEWRLRIELPPELMRYAHPKGSISIDGVSLTVADLEDGGNTVDVCLIPETLARTTLGERIVGDSLQLEMDCLAKMLARLVERR